MSSNQHPKFRPRMAVVSCSLISVRNTSPNSDCRVYAIQSKRTIISQKSCQHAASFDYPRRHVMLQGRFPGFFPLSSLQSKLAVLWTNNPVRNGLFAMKWLKNNYLPEKMTMAVSRAYSALSTFIEYMVRQKCNKSSIVSPMPAKL